MKPLAVLIFFFFSTVAFCQDQKVFELISKDQKSFFKQKVPTAEKQNYRYIVNSESKAWPKVIQFILTTDPAYLQGDPTINIATGYNGNSSSFLGMIWKSDSIVYVFDYITTDSVHIVKKELSVNALDYLDKKILDNFNNWSHSIFSHIRADMWTSLDGTYYIASKYSLKNQPSVKTIAFYQ